MLITADDLLLILPGYSTDQVCDTRNTTSGECCVFPFTYRGETYYDCITKDFNSEWCSLDEDYDKHKRFGLCGRRTSLISHHACECVCVEEARNSRDLQEDK